MSDYLVTDTELTETADAIRAKTGDSNAIEWESGTGFADAVAAIPSGGGNDYVPINCVSVVNNATVGYQNGIPIPISVPVIKKIEVRFKRLSGSSDANVMWFTSLIRGAGYFRTNSPFVAGTGRSELGSSTVLSDETVDGIRHITVSNISVDSSYTDRNVFIGSWVDSTYSATCAYYEYKIWGENDELLFDFKPMLYRNKPVFFDDVTKMSYLPLSGVQLVAGEAI